MACVVLFVVEGCSVLGESDDLSGCETDACGLLDFEGYRYFGTWDVSNAV